MEMEERITVVVSLKGTDQKLYLKRSANGKLTFADSAKKVLKDVSSFLNSAFLTEGVKELNFDKVPDSYEIPYGSFSIRRVPVEHDLYSSCAFFDVTSFEGLSLGGVANFIMEYSQSNCSKDFNQISFIPRADTDYRFLVIFNKDEIKEMSEEKLKDLLGASKLFGCEY